jgi:hypothetical protein
MWLKIRAALRRAPDSGTKYLRDDGTWSTPSGGGLPDLTGNAGKYLKVADGEASTEWATVSGGSGLTHPQVLARTLGA